MTKPQPFNYKKSKIDSNSVLYTISLEKITPDLKKYIDETIVTLCRGNRNLKVSTVKKELLDYLNAKRKSQLFIGSITEFFVHLFLLSIKFKQEFVYLNLEEGSIKKGFDGVYTKKKEMWIAESKSGDSSSKGISHKRKISEAYRDLKGKLAGHQKNPWNNAYYHAKAIDSDESLLKKINELSENYTESKFELIEDYNVMPCSTIVMNKSYSKIKRKKLKTELSSSITHSKNKICFFCCNKKSLENLIDYLKI